MHKYITVCNNIKTYFKVYNNFLSNMPGRKVFSTE